MPGERNLKILVLEDEGTLRESICEYLKEFTGGAVAGVASESEALAALGEDAEIDVIVVNLGKNRDGRFIFLGVIKANYPVVKRVLFTGFSREEMLGELRTAVCDAVVYKPRIEDLFHVVNLNVHRSG